MKFSKVRQTAVKGIDTPDPHNRATPHLLSPYEDQAKLRPRRGVHPHDIPKPLHNRRSRRALGITRPRQRQLGGVALTSEQQPWKPAVPA